MTVLSLFLISLGINGIFFIFAAILKTDIFTDITYSLTFITLSLTLLLTADNPHLWQIFAASAVILWGIRLGSYLFTRILLIKVDHRFDDKRNNVIKFGSFWILQAITVAVVMLPVYGLITVDGKNSPPTGLLILAGILFFTGLTIETIADAQKFAFKKTAAGKGRWMESGIWRYSRHPNYFGEMLVWWSIALPGITVFSGFQWFYFIGPAFITFLLLFVSGIPLLEKEADRKWGTNADYLQWKHSTSLLVPFFPRKTHKQ